MKRLLICLLCVCAGLMLIVPAAAQEQDEKATILVEPVSGMEGSSVLVPIRIRNNPGFAGADLAVSYDKDRLTLKEIRRGSLLKNSSGSFDMSIETGVILWYDTALTNGDGVLAELEFEILPTEQYIQTEVSVSLFRGMAKSFCGIRDAIPVQFQSGAVGCCIGKLLLQSAELSTESGQMILNVVDAPVDKVDVIVAAYDANDQLLGTSLTQAQLQIGKNSFSVPKQFSAGCKLRAFILTPQTAEPLCEPIVFK